MKVMHSVIRLILIHFGAPSEYFWSKKDPKLPIYH